MDVINYIFIYAVIYTVVDCITINSAESLNISTNFIASLNNYVNFGQKNYCNIYEIQPELKKHLTLMTVDCALYQNVTLKQIGLVSKSLINLVVTNHIMNYLWQEKLEFFYIKNNRQHEKQLKESYLKLFTHIFVSFNQSFNYNKNLFNKKNESFFTLTKSFYRSLMLSNKDLIMLETFLSMIDVPINVSVKNNLFLISRNYSIINTCYYNVLFIHRMNNKTNNFNSILLKKYKSDFTKFLLPSISDMIFQAANKLSTILIYLSKNTEKSINKHFELDLSIEHFFTKYFFHNIKKFQMFETYEFVFHEKKDLLLTEFSANFLQNYINNHKFILNQQEYNKALNFVNIIHNDLKLLITKHKNKIIELKKNKECNKFQLKAIRLAEERFENGSFEIYFTKNNKLRIIEKSMDVCEYFTSLKFCSCFKRIKN